MPLRLRRQVQALLLPEGLHLPGGRRDRRGDPGGPAEPRGAHELDNALAVQREKFIAKFGREPGPDDLIFFDLDEDKLRDDTASAMRAAGIQPALIYAYEETGLIVTQENRRLISENDLREFDAKVREFYDLHLGDDPKTS